ncbi:hypothetical protein IWW38_005066 [Coemansia aciculifera]|uniref:Uncharacterized protein n=1 Tax=Coemansia aciculifera TaxID=417176 RepID=A0ACC1LWX9_9FUNG|nr:hypothetical protein IWW38_005066 [Coemansia aciculifera]
MSDINTADLSIGRALAKASATISAIPTSHHNRSETASPTSSAAHSDSEQLPTTAVDSTPPVAQEHAVFSPAKNPYARSKPFQRSRPSLSLFSAPAATPKPDSSAAADVNRRPFSRNGEEEEKGEEEVEDEKQSAEPVRKPAAAVSHSPSRIPRPPSLRHASQQHTTDSSSSAAASVVSLMATLSITGAATSNPQNDEFTAALNNM